MRARTEGFEDWLKTVEDCTPEPDDATHRSAGPSDLRGGASLCQSGASMALHGLGVTEHRWGSHGVMALGKSCAGHGQYRTAGHRRSTRLRGQNNVQGASDVGCLPTYFAGYQSFDDPELAAAHRP